MAFEEELVRVVELRREHAGLTRCHLVERASLAAQAERCVSAVGVAIAVEPSV